MQQKNHNQRQRAGVMELVDMLVSKTNAFRRTSSNLVTRTLPLIKVFFAHPYIIPV